MSNGASGGTPVGGSAGVRKSVRVGSQGSQSPKTSRADSSRESIGQKFVNQYLGTERDSGYHGHLDYDHGGLDNGERFGKYIATFVLLGALTGAGFLGRFVYNSFQPTVSKPKPAVIRTPELSDTVTHLSRSEDGFHLEVMANDNPLAGTNYSIPTEQGTLSVSFIPK